MGSQVRAYRCGDLRSGELRRDRGLRVGATIADAIALWANRGVEYGTPWPPRVFEGTVEAEDVLSTEAHAMNVRAMLIERELPFGAVLGPRADDLVKFIDDVARTRWLRPEARSNVEGQVADLVAEHYAALSDYGPVTAPPVQIVRTWHEARDVYATLELRPEAANVAITTACAQKAGTTEEITVQMAMARVARLAFFGAWEASWPEAERSATTGASAVSWFRGARESDEHYRIVSATRAVEGLLKALHAARDPAWHAGWDAGYELFTSVRSDVPDLESMFAPAVAAALATFAEEVPVRPRHGSDCATCASAAEGRNGIVAAFTNHTCVTVWMLAMKAAQNASTRAGYLVNAVPKADPWRPLFDIWRLGAWPLGASKRSFLVFLPMPRS